jgi:hypothetical protein
VTKLYPQTLGSLFVASYDSQSYGGGFRSCLHGKELSIVKVIVKVTLRLMVYCQSVRLGVRPLETHDQRFFFQLNSCCNSPYVTSSLTRRWVCLVWICLAFRQVYNSHMQHATEKSSFRTIYTRKSSVSPGITEQIMPILRILCYNGRLSIDTTSPRYRALARTARKSSLPLLRILSLPGKQRVHRDVP